MAQTSRWQMIVDPSTGADAREEAWQSLRGRIRPPILFQLRRRMEGYRHTEDVADDICTLVRARYEGAGDEAMRLRDCLRQELANFFEEAGKDSALDDDEFDRDWATAFFASALDELRRQAPDAHLLFLRAYERPEQPLTPAQIAAKLDLPIMEVAQRMETGRAELRTLFEREIGHTVSRAEAIPEELDRYLPRAHALLA